MPPTLIWDSKTNPDPLPSDFTTESILYPGGAGYPAEKPENRLILGDNYRVMSTLLQDYPERFDLIYADPPFFSNKRYRARVGRKEDSRHPESWLLADGYQDHWKNIDAYLDMLYPRLQLMHRLLAKTGTLYLHLDWHASHYAKLLLDDLFGAERFLNEIVWVYHGPSPIRSAFKRKHDTILVYTKSDDYTFNADAVREPYHPNTVKTFASSAKAGFGKVPDLARGKVPEDWWYFPVVARLHNERTGYPTQKPEALLKRILLASSNPGDLVGDFFCGSGTTAVVAGSLERNFIAADMQWRAVQTTYSRLAGSQVSPVRLDVESNARIPVMKASARDYLDYKEDDGVIRIKPEVCDDLEYWELDPDWDGKVFRSVFQSKRPKRKGEFVTQTRLPRKRGKIAVRLVRSNGEQIRILLESPGTE